MTAIAAMIRTWARGAIADCRMTQTAVAEELTRLTGRNIDKAAVNKMLLGKRRIAADELVALAEITGERDLEAILPEIKLGG